MDRLVFWLIVLGGLGTVIVHGGPILLALAGHADAAAMHHMHGM